MIPANSYNDILNELNSSSSLHGLSGSSLSMLAILFAPPHTAIAKDTIVPRLDYFHHRSGNAIDLFCVGYGGYMQRSKFPDMIDVCEQTTAEGIIIPWGFSNLVFNEMREKLENNTKWKYSGEVDLILLTAYVDQKEDSAKIDFSNVLVFDLDLMLRDKAIHTVGRLFEEVFRYSEGHLTNQNTISFSDSKGLRALRISLFDGLLSMLPKALGVTWKKSVHFRTVNFGARKLEKRLIAEKPSLEDNTVRSRSKPKHAITKKQNHNTLRFAPRLLKAIKEQLQIETGYSPIELVGLNDMRVLKASVCEIDELLGIEHCKSLNELYLELNDITNIERLHGLMELRKLYLKSNDIVDINPISSLTNLTHLNLGDNAISDLSAIRDLVNLKHLYLSMNRIEDILPLVENCNAGGLGEGDEIYLSRNPLNKASINEYIPYLNKKGVSISYDKPSGIESEHHIKTGILSVHKIEKEVELCPLSNNRDEDIYQDGRSRLLVEVHSKEGLYYAPSLYVAIKDQLGLGGKPGRYRPVKLTGFDGMQVLNASNRKICHLLGIETCTSLVELHLENNGIQNIIRLSSLKKLHKLFLKGNMINDIQPLSGLTHLTHLDLSGNSIEKLDHIQSLNSLCFLGLSCNKIIDILPLVENVNSGGMSEGCEVYLDKNPLNKKSTEEYIPYLKEMGLSVFLDHSEQE